MKHEKPSFKTLFGIGVIASAGVFAGSVLAPIEARYIGTFTDSPVVIGSVFGVGSIFFAVLSIYIGRWSDRVGRKNIILSGLLFGVLYALLYSTVFNVLQIYGVKFAWAVAAIATGPVLAAYLQDFLEPFAEKGKYFGYVYAAQSIAGSAGAFLGGFVAEEYGLSASLLVLSGVYVVMFVFALLALPRRAASAEEVAEKADSRTLLQTLHYVIERPALQFYLAVNTSFAINWGIKAFLWPLLIFEIAGSDLITGAIFATMGVVAFLLLPFAGVLVDRIGYYRVMGIELLILGSTGVGMAFANDISVFWVLAAFYTIGEVLNGPAQAVLLTDNVESQMRGEVMGIDATMDQFLAVVAPVAAGLLIATVGLAMTFLIFMGLFWVSLAIVSVMYKKAY